MALVRFPQPSRRSSPRLWRKQSKRSRPCTRRTRRTLGDKLQALAGRSPAHLRAVEALVDLILKRLELIVMTLLTLA